ncbi:MULTISPECIES: alpha/beta hydrolase [Actinosynnema]|uniref:alpha/beta fold hydrolase n=1 Tax=Actinosynnema TaxID=40566 RepID=UPI0027E24AB6|nr:alpha/beta hydrolase [Actinosynnema pretiosum]
MNAPNIPGTSLSYDTHGEGGVSVIAHGVQTIAGHWSAVASGLPGRTLVANRRGRAGSGELGPDYALGTEVSDLNRVLDFAGPNAVLVGHSYGGAIALLAAAEREDLAALVLYDPVLPLDKSANAATLDRIDAALAKGDRDEAFRVVLAEVVGDSAENIEAFRTGAPDDWAAMLELVESTRAELAALNDLEFDPAVLDKITVPTTVLLGELSDREPLAFGPTSRLVVDRVPDAELVVLPGQHHVAHAQAPELLVERIAAARGVAPVLSA